MVDALAMTFVLLTSVGMALAAGRVVLGALLNAMMRSARRPLTASAVAERRVPAPGFGRREQRAMSLERVVPLAGARAT
jgi:hypothetical protein